MDSATVHRSGFAGLVGRPNVGKSTLVNRLAGSRVAITSDRPQTTRNRIRAVLHLDGAQLVLVDTPGFHKPRSPLGEKLNLMVRSTMSEVDIILFVLDVGGGIGRGDEFIAGELKKTGTPVVGVLNKIDLVKREQLPTSLIQASKLCHMAAIVPVSATTGSGLPELTGLLVGMLPEGPAYFPDDMVSDQPERMLVAELIREKALELTREEVPHSVAVLVEEIRPGSKPDLLEVEVVLYVEKESQKGIIVGRGGRMIKEIGSRARREIEALLGSRIYLDLRVKVEKDWTRNPAFIRRLELY